MLKQKERDNIFFNEYNLARLKRPDALGTTLLIVMSNTLCIEIILYMTSKVTYSLYSSQFSQTKQDFRPCYIHSNGVHYSMFDGVVKLEFGSKY